MKNYEKDRLIGKLDDYVLTGFQKEVLKAALNIPKGEVRTYKEIAESIGRPGACRAVGTALGKNPLAPMIPCHRVIKSTGDVGGYSGFGGRRKKMQLLKTEKAVR